MRRMFSLVIGLALIFGLTVTGYADLKDMGDGTVYDTDTKITWLKDASYAVTSNYPMVLLPWGGMTWTDANVWAANLVYAGYDDWRLPTTPGTAPETQEGEMGNLYTMYGILAWGPETNTGPFINLQPGVYWTGTEYFSDSAQAWLFCVAHAHQVLDYKSYPPWLRLGSSLWRKVCSSPRTLHYDPTRYINSECGWTQEMVERLNQYSIRGGKRQRQKSSCLFCFRRVLPVSAKVEFPALIEDLNR